MFVIDSNAEEIAVKGSPPHGHPPWSLSWTPTAILDMVDWIIPGNDDALARHPACSPPRLPTPSPKAARAVRAVPRFADQKAAAESGRS